MQLQFGHVAKIVATDKYFDISLPELVRIIGETREGELLCDYDLSAIAPMGPDQVRLRLNISCAHPKYVEGWTVSLKMHKTRIDGIDYQPRYYDPRGVRHCGWHRNVWNGNDEAANEHQPLEGFDDINSIEQFLIRSFKVMRITLNKVDHGRARLWDD
jgi:hypothetical protein